MRYGLGPDEIAGLRDVGEQWERATAGRRKRLHALPIDPALHRFPTSSQPTGVGRFAAVDLVASAASDQINATTEAEAVRSGLGATTSRLRRVVFGAPLTSSAIAHERMCKLIALPILSSDALSSVAYGPEAMLAVLALAGSAALRLSLAISAVIVVLMLAVGLSYRQLIKAYPHGGGSYIVAGENLGQFPALIAAAGLLIDYVLTVAVSISAGIAAVTSALPGLRPDAVPLGLGAIAILLVGNLRGVREAGALFSAPTYAFVLAMLILVAVGLIHASAHGFVPTPVGGLTPVEGIGVLLILRAFSSGATAMTGIEAVSNAVPALKPPEWRNARTVLSLMLALLIAMFAGLIVVIHLDGIVPRPGETVLSQLAHRSVGSGVLYGYIQVSTALVLLLAANTAFNGFPRLLSFMAHNDHAPRLFLRLGDRLAFNNGAILLATAAAALFAAFDAKTESLIPLYAVGVFIAFTFSQTGMVVHWWRRREPHWRKNITLNALGAALSAIVFVVAAATKFMQGAWVSLVLIGFLVTATWRIRCHYRNVRQVLALRPEQRTTPQNPIVPRQTMVAGQDNDGSTLLGRQPEREESPDQVRNLAIVPVGRLDLSSLRALAYAASLGQPVLAVHLSPDDGETERFRSYWETWGDHVPVQIVNSPYRTLTAPLIRYIQALQDQQPGLTITVVLAEVVAKHLWQQPLHSQTSRRLRHALRHKPGIVTATIPIHLTY